jgi:hypothetical protein
LKLGEECNLAKLTSHDVITIRHLYSTGSVTQTQLALEYRVTQSAIWGIVRRKTWKHLT